MPVQVCQCRLIPLQERVRPATYAPNQGQTGSQIVIEERHIDGELRETVLLDSIPSQANRMEEVLYDLRDELGLPDVCVDLSAIPSNHLPKRLSQWQLPHRIYDAVVRDSELDGKPFFETGIGQKVAVGDPQSLFKLAPNVLLFGGWNSHAQQGVGHVRAARIERAVTAELLGLDPKPVNRTASRLDPTGIPGDAGPPSGYEALKKTQKLSELGLGNVAPHLEPLDVSIAEARLEFTLTSVPWERMGLPEEARQVLWDLALLALAKLYENGIHLRSGTELFPAEALRLRDPVTGDLKELPPSEELIERVREGVGRLPEGYGWNGEPLVLTPSKRLADLLAKIEEIRGEKR